MLKGCKFRIYPTKEQEKILFEYCWNYHNLWNFIVNKFKDYEKLPLKTIGGIQGFSAAQLRNEYNKNKILLPQRLYAGILITYGNATNRVIHKIGRRPKFHKYNKNQQSFYLPSREYKVSNTIPMPKVQGISFKGISKIKIDVEYCKKFNITSITEPRYTYKNGKWFVSGSYKIDEPIKQKNISTIGLDWGIKNFMTSSTGEFINYPKTILREFYRINRLKSLRDKKNKNSNNWSKLNNKLILAYERFENLKKDFIEQITTRLCRHHNIAIEDLTNAKIKMSNKNRRRLQIINPLTRFINTLKWKCQKFGTDLYEVNPAYTSQICSCCGNRIKLTLKDRVFRCSCGNVMDRDINAAINIAAKAIRSSL